MEYKEYAFEDNKHVITKKLEVGQIPREDYVSAHQNLVILCADVMIWYKNGFLLVKRDNVPAKNELFCIGGRLQRGITSEEGMKKKVKAECGLDLNKIALIGSSRQFWDTEPFGHGKGTDTLSLMYYAEGIGDIKLDELHSKPIIVDKKKFEEIKNSLHPYVKDFMELAFKYRKEQS